MGAQPWMRITQVNSAVKAHLKGSLVAQVSGEWAGGESRWSLDSSPTAQCTVQQSQLSGHGGIVTCSRNKLGLFTTFLE